MKQPTQNMRLIAGGFTQHPESAVMVYRTAWQKQGYELPEYQPENKKHVPHVKAGCGCAKREQLMNSKIPYSGTLLRWFTTITGLKWLVDRWYQSRRRPTA